MTLSSTRPARELSPRAILTRVWESATLMTWANFGGRMLSVGLALPIALHRLSQGDAAYFLLLSSMISLQLILPAGFTPTFARFISYSLSGESGLEAPRSRRDSNAPAFDINDLLGTMRRVYLVIGAASVPLGTVLAIGLLAAPVAHTSNITRSWAAFAVILTATPLVLYSMQYTSYLQGANRIALEQRWGALFAIGASISNIVTLMLGGGVLALVISTQVWQVFGVLRLRYLAAKVARLQSHVGPWRFRRHIFISVWPSAWRSFVGVITSAGVTQASGLVYAQFVNAAVLAPFLLGLRLIAVVSELSRAPFYTKIPSLNRLYVLGDFAEMRRLSRLAMAKSYLLYIVSFGLALMLGPRVLHLFHTQTPFPDKRLWILLGTSFLIERYGAMHVQVLSTSNRIIWHWANGITGIVLILLSIATFPTLGIYGFAASIGIAYLICYSWVAPLLSYRLMRTQFLTYERRAFFGAICLHGLVCAGALLIR